MNAISIKTPLFTIADTVITVLDGLFSLNDLHKASGGADKHRPTFFLRNEETKALIAEIECSPNLVNGEKSIACKVFKGGNDRTKQGTYVCKELVYRYAMWISAKFSLMVIRAFDAMVSRSDSQQRQALVTACDKLAVGHALRSDVYKMVGNHFGYDDVASIPTPLLPEAVAFVYEQLLAKQKHQEPNISYIANPKDSLRWIISYYENEHQPNIKPIPNDCYIVNEQNIAKLIQDSCFDRRVLPDVMRAVVSRLL